MPTNLEDQQNENMLKLSALHMAIKAGLDSGAGGTAEDVLDRLESKYLDMVGSERT